MLFRFQLCNIVIQRFYRAWQKLPVLETWFDFLNDRGLSHDHNQAIECCSVVERKICLNRVRHIIVQGWLLSITICSIPFGFWSFWPCYLKNLLQRDSGIQKKRKNIQFRSTNHPTKTRWTSQQNSASAHRTVMNAHKPFSDFIKLSRPPNKRNDLIPLNSKWGH